MNSDRIAKVLLSRSTEFKESEHLLGAGTAKNSPTSCWGVQEAAVAADLIRSLKAYVVWEGCTGSQLMQELSDSEREEQKP